MINYTYRRVVMHFVFFIERFHSRDYQPYWFTETKESFCIKIELNSQRFSLGHQHGRHFFVLGHQHGRRDVVKTLYMRPGILLSSYFSAINNKHAVVLN